MGFAGPTRTLGGACTILLACRVGAPLSQGTGGARARTGDAVSDVVAAPSNAGAEDGDATARACPPIDAAKLAEFELDTQVLTIVPPPIVDDTHVLGHLYARLVEIARGRAKDHVRIGVYGDSNMTMDYITSAMRRALAARFGDAGHGFVALARPWQWYRHQDVRHDLQKPLWRMFATSTNHVSDGYYGFANIAAETTTSGAVTWVETADDSAPMGTKCSRFDVYYLKRPRGGSFTIRVDGADLRTVSTAADGYEAGFEGVDVPDGPHKLECVAGKGRVRLFGVTLERNPEPARYGVQVDSLGVGALNFEQMTHVESTTRVQMLAHRKYDLVVFLIGTNMFAPEYHATWVKQVLTDFRTALPETPILILSPPDIVLHHVDLHSDPRIVRLAKQMKTIAAAENAAFWDFRDAMGGDAAIQRFHRMHLAEPDRVHLSRDGGAVMGNRLVYAIFKDMQKWLPDHPDAGCP
ncbi:MAG TPA: GDSL-type esterase/lipase family protein [Polyangiaceae bacterium]|nr:GDSL-type esterase/lipase family protein [Polyangiaceae bacterium]